MRGSKVYNGHLQTHLGQENGQPGKKGGGSTFVKPAHKDPLLIELLPNVGLSTFVYSIQDVFQTMKIKSLTM
jgi:hypothetical protein